MWSSPSASSSPSSPRARGWRRCCGSATTTPRSSREVFGNIPGALRAALLHVVPSCIVYGAVLFAQRVRNWERGRPDRRATTPANVGRRLQRLPGRASTCRRCCATRPPGIMHSLIYFGFLVLLARHHRPGDQPPAARVGQVPPRRRVPGLRARRRRGRRRLPGRRGVGHRPPLRPAAALPHPHQVPARARASSSGRSSPSGVTGFLRRGVPHRPRRPARLREVVVRRLPAVVAGRRRLDSLAGWHQALVDRPRGRLLRLPGRSCPTTMLRHMFTSPLNMYLRDRERPKGAMKPLPNLDGDRARELRRRRRSRTSPGSSCSTPTPAPCAAAARACARPTPPASRSTPARSCSRSARSWPAPATRPTQPAHRRRPGDHRHGQLGVRAHHAPRRSGRARRARRATRSARSTSRSSTRSSTCGATCR